MSGPVALKIADLPMDPSGRCLCTREGGSLKEIGEIDATYRRVWYVGWAREGTVVTGVTSLRALRSADGTICLDPSVTPREHVPPEEHADGSYDDTFFDEAHGPTLLRMWADTEERHLTERIRLVEGD
jgi:hypothetical protein